MEKFRFLYAGFYYTHLTGARMAQWRNGPGVIRQWIEFVVVSRPWSKGFSPGSQVFFPSQKPTRPNFNFIRNLRATDLSVERLLNATVVKLDKARYRTSVSSDTPLAVFLRSPFFNNTQTRNWWLCFSLPSITVMTDKNLWKLKNIIIWILWRKHPARWLMAVENALTEQRLRVSISRKSSKNVYVKLSIVFKIFKCIAIFSFLIVSSQQKWLERPDHQILLNIESECLLVFVNSEIKLKYFLFCQMQDHLSYALNLSSWRNKTWKQIQAWTRFQPMSASIPVQCSINWAVKPTGSWSLRAWVCNIPVDVEDA